MFRFLTSQLKYFLFAYFVQTFGLLQEEQSCSHLCICKHLFSLEKAKDDTIQP